MDDPFPVGMVEHINEFLAEDQTRPAGKDCYDEVFADPYMFPLQRRRELVKMIQLARSYLPKVIMDIGSDKCGGLYHWCKCFSHVEKVISCEIRGTPCTEAFEKAFPNTKFLWLPVSSYSRVAAAAVDHFLDDDRIDVLWIDGDKSNFETDFNLYRPYMNSPGLVMMHDITDHPYPGESFDTCCAAYAHDRLIDREESVAATAREDEGIPVANNHEGWLRHWKGQSCGVGVIYIP